MRSPADHRPETAVVIVVSTSASRGEQPDRTGPVLLDWLERKGFAVPAGVEVVADGEPCGRLLAEAVERSPDVIVTTGGTGLSPDDRTPELTRPLIDRSIPGVLEEVRRRGLAAGVPSALLTRGACGFAGSSFVVNLPGSTGGVADGIAVLDGVLDHLLDQARGGGGHGGR